MSQSAWKWKLSEAIDRLRTRYDHIGRKHAAPFLAVVYPPGAEQAFLHEWHAQTASLPPDFDVRAVDVLAVTDGVLTDIGPEHVVSALSDPMPGSDPGADLGNRWVESVVEAARELQRGGRPGRPIVCLERLAALYPTAGPRDVMQSLWDSPEADLEVPVVLLIPGTVIGPRRYSFLDMRDEYMYRGDLL